MSGIAVKSKLPCPDPDCGSSDAFHVYRDEQGTLYGKCYSCSKGFPKLNDDFEPVEQDDLANISAQMAAPPYKSYEWREHSKFPSAYRGISPETYNKYGVECNLDYSSGAARVKDIVFPYHNELGDKIIEKTYLLSMSKGGKKSMPLEKAPGVEAGDMCLFGMHLFPKGGKRVSVTEGEADAMSIYEMQGDWPVVSLPKGADSAIECLKNKANLEFLRSFGEIIICFDADEAGRRAATQFADFFTGKAKIVELAGGDLKDANDYLRAGKKEAFKRAWWGAQYYTPGDIVLGSSLVDLVADEEIETYVPYPFEGLNEMLYGMHTPEVVLFTAPPKVGKSLVTGKIVQHLLEAEEGFVVADLSIEDTPVRRAKTLVSLHMNRPLHRPEVRSTIPNDEIRAAAKNLFGNGNYYGYDNFGAQSAQDVIDRIRYMVTVAGCKYVILDHISFLASYHDQDERKALDQMSNQLAQMAVSLNFCLIVVAHLNREGKVHGSSNLEKTCFVHIDMDRDKDNDNPDIRNLVTLRVKLNRRYGDTGKCYARFSSDPFTLVDCSTEEAEKILGIAKDED